MSSSQGVNVGPSLPRALCHTNSLKVLRWSALAVGIFYGFSHQRTITAQNHAAHAQAEWKHKEDLIQKAKLEWKKKQNPGAFTKGDDGGTCRLPTNQHPAASALDPSANTSQSSPIPRTRTLTSKHTYRKSPLITRNEKTPSHRYTQQQSPSECFNVLGQLDTARRVLRFGGLEEKALYVIASQKSLLHMLDMKHTRLGTSCRYAVRWAGHVFVQYDNYNHFEEIV